MATITTRYHTINGQIRAESSSSVFPSLIYLPDSLGNVTQVVTNTTAATSVARRRYRAYGTLAYQAPTTYAGPLFNYEGALGCRRTGRSHAGIEMGARVFSPTDGRFITRVRTDKFLLGENPYGYATGNPSTYTDPSGLAPGTTKGCCQGQGCSPLTVNGAESVCGQLFAALAKCGVAGNKDPMHAGSDPVCDVLGTGQCEQAARLAGVDPVILCGAMINEHAGPSGQGPALYDFTVPAKELGIPMGRTPWAPSGVSGGMISLKPKTAYECYRKGLRCNPGLVKRLGLGSWPSTSWGTLRKISIDPVFAMNVAALCMYVATNPQCNGRNAVPPGLFPVTWNPRAFPRGWPRNPGTGWYSSREICVTNALSKFNPF